MRCPPHVDDVIEILSRTSLCGLNTLDHNRVTFLYDKLQSKTLELVALNTHPVPTLIQWRIDLSVYSGLPQRLVFWGVYQSAYAPDTGLRVWQILTNISYHTSITFPFYLSSYMCIDYAPIHINSKFFLLSHPKSTHLLRGGGVSRDIIYQAT